MRPVPKAAIKLIKSFEGFSPKPYLCPAGVPTIGYGTTVYPDDKPVSISDAPISEEDATKYLALYLTTPMKVIEQIVKRKLSSNELSALLSFTYNLGLGAFQLSTLLKVINGEPGDLKSEWLRWNKAGGRELAGLTRRREAEYALFTRTANQLLPEGPTEEEINNTLSKVESTLT